jgi:hypothetical protein
MNMQTVQGQNKLRRLLTPQHAQNHKPMIELDWDQLEKISSA